MRTGYLVAASFALHAGLFGVISRKSKQIEQRQTLIAMVEQQKKKAEEAKKEEPKPVEAPKEVLQPRPAPAPAPPTPQTPAPTGPSEAMQAMPDYGLNLSGGGGGNMALPEKKGGAPAGTAKVEPAAKPVEKTLGNPQSVAAKDPDLAAEIAAWKPRPAARVKPVYPDEARSAEIEGTVTVEAVVDCTGKVKDARVLSALGHGLDQAALIAIKKTDFEPAPRCAPGFQKTVKINYAFRLGD